MEKKLAFGFPGIYIYYMYIYMMYNDALWQLNIAMENHHFSKDKSSN